MTSKAKRRSFTAEYKRKVLQEVDGCTERGQVGALLRREGLYSSHLTEWRALRESGALAGLEKCAAQGREREASDHLRHPRKHSRAQPHLLEEKLGRTAAAALSSDAIT